MIPLPPPANGLSISFSPQSRLHHINQEVHRDHSSNTVFRVFTHRPPLDLKKQEDIKKTYESYKKAQADRTESIQELRDHESAVVLATKQVLSPIAQKYSFRFRIMTIEREKLEDGEKNRLFAGVTIDFSKSNCSLQKIKDIVNEIELLPECGSLFTLKNCNLNETVLVHLLLQRELDCMKRHPSTSQLTKSNMKKNAFPFHVKFTKKAYAPNKSKWGLDIDFSSNPMTKDEIQYLLWKIIKIKEYGKLFEIEKIDFSMTAVDMKTFANSAMANEQYPAVSGDEIGNALYNSLTDLNLNHCRINPDMLLQLSKFQNLKRLNLNYTIQKKNRLVKEDHIRAACPNLLELSFRWPRYVNSA